MPGEFQVTANNGAARFTLKLHRGDGMLLLAMDWKKGKPPLNFVGFAIQYKEPGGAQFFPLKNRLTFPVAKKSEDPNRFRRCVLLCKSFVGSTSPATRTSKENSPIASLPFS
jgi:hypothetical protein